MSRSTDIAAGEEEEAALGESAYRAGRLRARQASSPKIENAISATLAGSGTGTVGGVIDPCPFTVNGMTLSIPQLVVRSARLVDVNLLALTKSGN